MRQACRTGRIAGPRVLLQRGSITPRDGAQSVPKRLRTCSRSDAAVSSPRLRTNAAVKPLAATSDHPTHDARTSMVRMGSTVRVRQRASWIPPTQATSEAAAPHRLHARAELETNWKPNGWAVTMWALASGCAPAKEESWLHASLERTWRLRTTYHRDCSFSVPASLVRRVCRSRPSFSA
jgi:broad specificity phosphatase PhoE